MKKIYQLLVAAGALCLSTGLYAQNLYPAANDKGKFGYVDETGEKVISYSYKEAYPFEEGMAKVRKGDKYGFINPKGKAIGKIKYTVILPFTGSYCRVAVGGSYKDGVLKGEKWGFMNKRGEEILPPEYDEIGEFEDGIAFIRKGNKYGLINDDIDILLEPKQAAVGTFDRFGYCWFAASGKVNKKSGKLEKGKYGLINKEGEILIEPKYAFIGYFYKTRLKNSSNITDYDAGTSAVYNRYSLEKPLSQLYNPDNFLVNALSGCKTESAADSVRMALQDLQLFTDSTYFIFSKSGYRYGVMNDHGDILIEEKKFNLVYCPSNDISLVGKVRRKKTHFGYYNLETGYLKEFKENEFPFSYRDGLGKVQNLNDNSSYFVDKSGNRVTDTYGFALNFTDGRCIVQDKTSGKWGVIDTQGNALLPLAYDDIHQEYREGALGVCKAGNWGFVDMDGKPLTPMAYGKLTYYQNGWAGALDKNGKWGMIDKQNQSVIPFSWEDILLPSVPQPEWIWVKKAGTWQCFSRSKQAMAFQGGFERAWNFEDGLAVIQENGLVGVVDTRGDLIVPCRLSDYFKVKDVLGYMKQSGRQKLTETDAYRLNLWGDETVNSFEITSKIPDNLWDY